MRGRDGVTGTFAGDVHAEPLAEGALGLEAMRRDADETGVLAA